MNTVSIVHDVARHAPGDIARSERVATLRAPKVEPQVIIGAGRHSTNADFDAERGLPDVDMRWTPLVVPLAGGLMACVRFLVSWLALALPLALG